MKLIEYFFYYSVGFASETLNKLTEIVQKLVEQDKLSEAEGNDFLKDYEKKIDEMTKKFDDKLEKFITEKMNDLHFITKEDLKPIEEKIDKIEKIIDKKLAEKQQN